MRVLIIIPVYNEELNIEGVVNHLMTNFPQYDYVIINDCSTDTTEKICKDSDYNVVSLCTNLGIGGGVQTGYLYAVENDYDFAVQMDGDGQHDPAFIEEMIESAVKHQYDMVIGSRFVDKKGFQSSASRRLGIKWLNRLIYVCCGTKVTDATSGFRVTSKRMNDFFAHNYAQDYPEPEAIVAASLAGYKVGEYPVVMKERQGGASSINWKRSIYYMIKVSIAIVIVCISTKRGKK